MMDYNIPRILKNGIQVNICWEVPLVQWAIVCSARTAVWVSPDGPGMEIFVDPF